MQQKQRLQQITVTPLIARQWLRFAHPYQRALNWDRVKAYTEAMLSNRWTLVPDAISFDQEGYLTNGRHRLQAVLESQRSQEFLVVEGLQNEAFVYTDQGQRRTAKQMLTAYGMEQRHADAFRVIASYPAISDPKKVSNARLLKVANAYQPIAQSIMSSAAKYYTATLRANLMLGIEYGLEIAKAQRVGEVLRLMEIEEPYENTILQWVNFKQKQTKAGLSAQKQEWFAAQRLIQALIREERVKQLSKNSRTFFPPKI